MEYYKNFSLKSLFYINENGLVCQEEWRDVFGFESRYQISNLGRIKSLNYNHSKKPKLLKQSIDKDGYFTFCAFKEKRFYLKIHRLVAQAFLPNPHNLPQVNHVKGIKHNNCFHSLEWCDAFHNNREALRVGLRVMKKGENAANAKLKEKDVLEIRQIHKDKKYGYKETSLKYNISRSLVNAIVDRKIWKHI